MLDPLMHTRELVGPPAKEGGPFSSAARYGNLIWTSGALPKAEDGTVPDNFEEQVRVALQNLHNSLSAAGADWSTVLKIQGYVKDIKQLPVLNEIYTDIVCQHGHPARTTVEVSHFRGNVKVEFDAVALRSDQHDMPAVEKAGKSK